MPILVADHHLKDFGSWFEMFKANPPPDIGHWRLIRGIDDPGRVRVIGEMNISEVEGVKAYFASDRMQGVFKRVNEMSTRPIELEWFEDVTPG
jgi:hypothetical protein